VKSVVVPDFAASIPAMLGASHGELSRELAVSAATFSLEEHDAGKAVERLRAAGVFALLVPAKDGGRAFEGSPGERPSVRALCLAREALGYVSPMADSIFAVQGLGSQPLVLTPDAPRRAELLGQVVRGERVCAFALTEPEAGSDVGSMKTTAVRDGDGFVLDGTKVFISNAGIADHYVVFARVPGAEKPISAFLVPKDAAGLRIESVAMSLDHPLGRLTFTRARDSSSARRAMPHAAAPTEVRNTSRVPSARRIPCPT
jgi:acyl-CoA dehydrogenase